MRKKKFILSILLSILMSLSLGISMLNSHAATPTPQKLDQVQINDLTTRIASRVAQLKLVEKRGIIGKVIDASNTQISVSDPAGNTRLVDVDEFTKFSSPSGKSSFGISDIKKGETLGILGLYNKDSRRILARFIDVLHRPEIIHGFILSKDAKNFSLSVALENAAPIDIDVESTTTTLAYTDSASLARSGFSKLEEGENIIVVGFYDLKNKNRIIASKIIAFLNIPKNPKIKISVVPTPTPTPTSALPQTPAPKTQKSQESTSY